MTAGVLKKIKNTQEVKKNAFTFDKTTQNAQILEEICFLEAMYNTKINNQFTSCSLPSTSIQLVKDK